jgi:hypothetical protein
VRFSAQLIQAIVSELGGVAMQVRCRSSGTLPMGDARGNVMLDEDDVLRVLRVPFPSADQSFGVAQIDRGTEGTVQKAGAVHAGLCDTAAQETDPFCPPSFHANP